MMNKAYLFKILFIVVCIALFGLFMREILFGWSSATLIGSTFATHQFLGKVALLKLQEHPALRLFGFRFPSEQEIAKYSGVYADKDLKVHGEGPDNLDNSFDSWHFYNPRTKEGKAPECIASFLEELKKKLLKNRNPDEAAREAAYLAHFIQDMSCPFHTVGMPKSELSADKPQGFDVVGPYRDFDAAEWRKIAEAGKSHKHIVKDKDRCDWFDPNYHDGPPGLQIQGSTHFAYEGIIEWRFKSIFNYTWEERMKNSMEGTLLSKEYTGAMKADEFAKAVALKTRDRLDNKMGNLCFDSKDFQKRFLTKFVSKNPQEMFNAIFWDMVWDHYENFTDFSRLLHLDFFPDVIEIDALFPTYVKVPYEDWQRGIRATYTMWRASFSALRVVEDELLLVKVPDQDNTYKLQVTVVNAEPFDDAYELKGRFSIEGGVRAEGDLQFEKSTIPAFEETDVSACSLKATGRQGFRVSESFITSPGNRKEKVTITLEGKYYNVPDSGLTVQVISLADVDMNTKPMPEVRELSFDDASNRVGILFPGAETPRVKNIRGKIPDDPVKNHFVYKQKPEPGVLIGPEDTVTLTIYDEYKMVRVPEVRGRSVRAARKKIQFKVNPLDEEWALKAIIPSGTEEDDVVLNTDPEPGTSVPFGSDVNLIIKPKEKPSGEFEQQGGTEVEVGPEERDELPPPEEEDDAYLQLSSLTIVPKSVELSLDKRKSAPLTVAALDLMGNKVSAEELSKMNFRWSVSDPSIAGIVGSGLKVSVYAIKEGVATAICSTQTQVDSAAVSVVEKGGAGEWEETSDWEVDAGGGGESETESGGRSEGESGRESGGSESRTEAGGETEGGTGQRTGETGRESRDESGGKTGGRTGDESGSKDQKDIGLLDVPVEEGGDITGLWSSLEEEDIVHPKRFFKHALALRITRQGSRYIGTVLAAGPEAEPWYPIGSKLLNLRRINKHYYEGTVHYQLRYSPYGPKTKKIILYCNTHENKYGPKMGYLQQRPDVYEYVMLPVIISLHKFPERYRYKDGRIFDFFQAIQTWPRKKRR